jgi:hypothetical protein
LKRFVQIIKKGLKNSENPIHAKDLLPEADRSKLVEAA